MSRRDCVSAFAATIAASAATSGSSVWLGSALAQTPQPIDPFAVATQSGPTSITVPAVAGLPAVPGSPFIVPLAPGWSSVSLLTTGNVVNGYRFAGIPDGLGAFDNGDGTITVLVAHELFGGRGAVRKYGGRGAFVSRWRIDVSTLAVLDGRELLQSPDALHFWRNGAWAKAADVPETARNMSRFCSADLAPASAFFNAKSQLGYDGRIFLTGEETVRAANRAFAFVVDDDTAYELPAFAFGSAGHKTDPSPSWENLLANPMTGDKTVVVATSDGGSSQVYVYLGTKQAGGNPVERAGLTNGKLYALKIADLDFESRETNVGLTKSIVGQGKGAPVTLTAPNKGTSFLRPEDGCWDPRNPNVIYFATTDRNNFAADPSVRPGQNAQQIGRSRLWAVTFDDVNNIATDGTPAARIEMLLDGTEGGDMFDNVTIDADGMIYLCEDAGNSRHISKIWSYDTKSGALSPLFRLDPAKFGDVSGGVYVEPSPPFIDDKESSGILDVTDLFKAARWFKPGAKVLLVDVQAHFGYDSSTPIGADLMNGGQLLLLAKAPA